MNKKFKILFTSDSNGVSGAEIVMLDIVKNLDKNKFIAVVFCNRFNKQLIQRLQEINIQYVTTSGYPKEFKEAFIIRTCCFLVSIFFIYFHITKIISKHKIDIIWANAYPNCAFCALPAFVYKKPMIWHVHNIRRIHWRNWFFYKIISMSCHTIITVSNACRKNLLKARIKPSKIVTIYNWVDLNRFNPQTVKKNVKSELFFEGHRKIVGMIGQPIPDKGHTYFIEAAAEVLKEINETMFIIVGYLFQTDYQRRLNDLINKFNIQKNFIFTGWRDDIPEVMASMDVLAHTRINAEPFGLVLAEAMAMRKPVVATATGGVPEVVIDHFTGFIVPPEDSKTLSNRIVFLLKNPDVASKMGANGRMTIEKRFRLDEQIKAIERLLFEILK